MDVVAGAAEERFVRQKKTKIFPKNALNFCLSEQETQLANIDAFAQAWNPGASGFPLTRKYLQPELKEKIIFILFQTIYLICLAGQKSLTM